MTLALAHEAFRQGVADVGAAADLLDHTTRRAVRRCDSLLVGWTGAAADSFAVAFGDWHAAADDCRTALLTMAEQLLAAQSRLDDADAGAAAALTELIGRLQAASR
ncbi:WXG100 family type VII secretion target [Nocardioides cheoyonin]|uniref:WXG100 family type VII secretion target n=1 Tax=Nocardioides cheoyonin TaxID=3156615 RepID=UPI0032B48F94